jgi:Tfp pilus assembly protein PilF
MRAKMATVIAAFVAVAAVATTSCSKNPAVRKGEAFDRGRRTEQKRIEAIVEYRKAIQIEPKFGEARYQLAEAYDRKGDAEKAFASMRGRSAPDNVDAQLKAGAFLMAARKFEQVKTRAQQISARIPRTSTAC